VPPPADGAPYERQTGQVVGSSQPDPFGKHGRAAWHFWIAPQRVGQRTWLVPASNTDLTMHGGQESTLLSMMLPLLHHGALS
jgi:NAD(P)H dehydrogenase (quinone)